MSCTGDKAEEHCIPCLFSLSDSSQCLFPFLSPVRLSIPIRTGAGRSPKVAWNCWIKSIPQYIELFAQNIFKNAQKLIYEIFQSTISSTFMHISWIFLWNFIPIKINWNFHSSPHTRTHSETKRKRELWNILHKFLEYFHWLLFAI